MPSDEFVALPKGMEDDEKELREALEAYKAAEGRRRGRKAGVGPVDELENAEPSAELSMRSGMGVNMAVLQGRDESLTELFERAIAGDIPFGRPLKPGEPDRLDERHIQVVMMRATGADQGVIARMTGFTESWVSIILNHPVAEYLLARIVGKAADNVVDLNKRIQATAAEAFEKVVQVMRTTADEALASKNGFQILAMAGYGPLSKNLNVNASVMPSTDAISDLAAAVREAREIKNLDYAEFVQAEVHSTAPASAGGVVPAAQSTQPPGSGNSGGGVPPTPGSQAQAA